MHKMEYKNMKEYTLYREGIFYKGQLHTHTTVSDGVITPEGAKELYKPSAVCQFLPPADRGPHCQLYRHCRQPG